MDLSERRAQAARHPWEIARSAFFRRLIPDSVDLGAVAAVLDIGAGDGWFAHELLAQLPNTTTVTCWDINYTDDDLDSVLAPRVIRTTVRPTGQFALILLMDVLEHITDDEAFLRNDVVPLLAGDGVLIVSVPAHPRLFTAHDTMLGHHRRYRPNDIRLLLGRHLRIISEGPLFSSLVALRAAQSVIEKVRAAPLDEQRGVGGWSHGSLLTNALVGVLETDARLGRALARRGRNLPGLSYWAVCRPNR
ncbi:MAG: methyltransferase domain-containing protein [Ilumatobacteraceae bacterium]